MSYSDLRTDHYLSFIQEGEKATRPGTQAHALYCVAEALVLIFDQMQGQGGRIAAAIEDQKS